MSRHVVSGAKPRFSEWGVIGKAAPSEARRAESGGGVLGEGQPALPVRGGAPAAQRFFYILSALDGFSWPSGNARVPPPKERIISSDLCKSYESSLRRVWGVLIPNTPSPVASRLRGIR